MNSRDHDHVVRPLLTGGETVTDLDDGTAWVVRLVSHSVVDGREFRYVVELEEYEEISATAVILDGKIVLEPVRYAEDCRGSPSLS